MAVAIRTKQEIERIRAAGRIVAQVLDRLRQVAAVGVTTGHLDRISTEIITQAGGVPLFKGVTNAQAKFDFPASICASINEQVVHGVPGPRKLIDGDIISIDCGVKLNGYCGDSATTIGVGNVAPETRALLDVTQEVLGIALKEAKNGVYWSHVAQRMQEHAESMGYGIVRDYVGHGIGRKMHEEPRLPNYVNQELLDNDLLLRKGMVLAVEPMLNMGTYKTRVLDDGWTVVTSDGKPAAHFEHTLTITENGAQVLTNLY